MKRASALMLCIVLCIGSLTGCANGSDNPDEVSYLEVNEESHCAHISWTYLNMIACQCETCGLKREHVWIMDDQDKQYCQYCFSPKEEPSLVEESSIVQENSIVQESSVIEESNIVEESSMPKNSDVVDTTSVVLNATIDTTPYSDAYLTYKYSVKQVVAPQCIPVAVTASSEKGDYTADKAIDGDTSTCWREGIASGWGESESLTVFFNGVQNLYYISFYMGDQLNSDSYYANGRPASILFEFSDGEKFTCDLQDRCSGWQTVLLSHKVVTTWVKISILTVFKGKDTAAADTAITEFKFYTYEDTTSFKVVYNGVNLREGPAVRYDERGTVNVGYMFTPIEYSEDKEWMKFNYEGVDVWIWLAFTAPVTVDFY